MRRELGVTDEAEHQGGDLLAVTNSNESFFTFYELVVFDRLGELSAAIHDFEFGPLDCRALLAAMRNAALVAAN